MAVITIPFSQTSDLICKLHPKKHKALLQMNDKYQGLCELVCNRILIDNDLGKGNDRNFLKNRLTVERMDEAIIKKSHILRVYSLFRRIIAYVFGIYPNNLFSFRDQRKLVENTFYRGKQINRTLLNQGLKNIEAEKTLKLEVFSRKCLSLSGHSLLIKKMSDDNYIFFDPNEGEHPNLSFSELCNQIDRQLIFQGATDIFLMKGEDFLKKWKKKVGEREYTQRT